MSVWLSALAPFVLVTGLALGPGLAVAYAVGARGIAAWGVAPALGMTVLTCGAVVAPVMQLAWTPGILAAGGLAVLLLATGAGLLLRWWRPAPPRPDRPRTRLLALSGAVLGGLGVVAAALPAMGSPDELVDSTDVVAHLNRIRGFLDRGNFSSLGSPSYPSGFHDLAASAMQLLPHLEIVRAANLTALAAAAVFWPVGVVALSRVTFGRSTVVLVGAGLASAAFTTFPFILMGWGVLWPNLLATALLPGVVGPALVAAGAARPPRGLPRPIAAVTTAMAVPGLTLSHPNGLVSLVMFVVLALTTVLVSRVRRASPDERVRPALALGVLLVAVVVVLVVAPRVSRQIADTASYDWVAHEPLGSTLRDVVLFSLQVPSPPWGLVIVMLLGAVACAARPRLRWVAVVQAGCVLLYVLAASGRTSVGTLLTGYWYNDKVRLAALATVPAVLLAVAGLGRLARLLRRLLLAFSPPTPHPPHQRLLPLVVATGTLSAFVIGTAGLNHDSSADLTARYYRPAQPDRVLLTAQDQADLGALAALIPPGVVTAGVPANGSSFLYALFDRPVLFDSLLLSPDPDSALIGLHLKEAATRTDVCDALRRKNVQYAVTGPVRYWLSLSDRTSGLAALGATPGFEQVGAAGRYRLYRITACGFDWDPADLR